MKTESKKFNQLLAAQIISTLGTWLSVSGLVAYFRISQNITDLQVGLMYMGPYLMTFLAAPWLGSLADKLEAKKAAVFTNWLLAGLTGSYCLLWVAMGEQKLIWPMITVIMVAKLPQLVTEPEFNRLFSKLALEKARAVRLHKLSTAWFAAPQTAELVYKYSRIAGPKLEEKSFDASTGVNSVALQVSTLSGVAVGPLLAAQFGAQSVFIADCATYIVAALLLTFLATRVPPVRRESEGGNVTVAEAFRYMNRTGRVGLTLMAFGAFTLWGAKDTLAPAIVSFVDLPVEWFGFYHITSTAAELAIATLVAAGVVSIAARKVRVYALAFALTAVATALAAWSQVPLLIFVTKFLEGLFGNLVGVALYASVVLRADERYQGSVTGIFNSLTRGWQTLAFVLPGYFSVKYGPAWTMFGVGCLMVALTVAGWLYDRLVLEAD